MMQAVLVIAALVVAFLLPGYCLTRRLFRVTTGLELLVLSITLGLTVPPLLVFFVAWAFGLVFSIPLVIGVALVLSLATVPWRFRAIPRSSFGDKVAMAAALAAAFVLLQFTDFHSVSPMGFFASCLHSIGLYLLQSDGGGTAIFDPALDGCVTYVLNHDPNPILGLGAVICDVRPANGVLFTSVLSVAGRATVELLTILVYTIVAGASMLLARLYVEDWRVRVATGLLTLVALHGVTVYMLNENAFALALGMVALFLMTWRPEQSSAGAVAGFLVAFGFGLRLPGLFWIFPLAFSQLTTTWRTRGATALGFVLGILPWFVIPWILRGAPFFYRLDDGVAVVHHFLGMDFLFRPLNWPVHDSFVRIPEQILPGVLYLPAVLLKSMGSAIAALACIGLATMGRVPGLRFPRTTVLLWTVPLWIVLLGQIYLDYEKVSYVLLSLPVVPVVLAAGFGRLGRVAHRRRSWACWFALALALAFVPGLLAGVEVPVDSRAHGEYEVIWPNTREAEWRFRPSDQERRDDLGGFALLPSLQKVLHGAELWQGLSGRCDHFVTGRTHVRFGEGAPDEARFDLEASVDEPSLPPSFPYPPSDFEQLAVSHIVFHFRLLVGHRPSLVVDSTPEGISVAVDAGDGPRELRWVSFFVDERDEDHPTTSAEVTLNGERVGTRSLGYQVDFPEETTSRLVLVTNLGFPEQEPSRGLIVWGAESGTCSWLVFKPDGSVDPGRSVDSADPFWSSAASPALTSTGPLLYPH